MKRKKWLAFSLAVLLALGLILPAGVPAKAAEKKLAAITYDDGPSSYTPQLLDGLKERGAKVTFFMVGQSAARYPATVARVYQEGHQVGNHTYSHPDLTTLSYSNLQGQLQGTNDILDASCGAGTEYMLRPPYGSVNNSVVSSVAMPVILWSVDPQDWLYRNAETVRRNIVNYAHDGAIIGIHDTHYTTVVGSLAAIDQLQAQGYEFVTVRELMRRRGVTPQNSQRYYKFDVRVDDPGPVTAPKVTAQPQGDKLLITMEAQAGTKIYYSTDGGSLNQQSRVYTGPFTADVPVRIKAAAAFNMNGSRSDTVEVSFTTPHTQTPQISVDNGTLSLSCATEGSEIYYSLGGEDLPYTGPVEIERGCSITAWACRPDYLDSAKTQAWYTPRGNLFADVSPSKWFFDSMDRAVEAGYMSGTGQNKFHPYEPLTRGQLVTLLHRFSGQAPEGPDMPFEDVPESAYYRDAIAWAYGNGFVRGTSAVTFGPDKPVTRQEMAVILFGYLQSQGIADSVGTADFSDWDSISEWAREAVAQMSGLGLLNGNGNGFDPLSGASRAQAAAVLVRMEELLDRT